MKLQHPGISNPQRYFNSKQLLPILLTVIILLIDLPLTTNADPIFSPTKISDDSRYYSTSARQMHAGISEINDDVDSFIERRSTDCGGAPMGRCVYQKFSYIFFSGNALDYLYDDCKMVGCDSFSKIGNQLASDLITKLEPIYNESNRTIIPVALVVVDITLLTDVPSKACSGLVELYSLLRFYALYRTIIFNIHGKNKNIDCGGDYLLKYVSNSNIFMIYNGVNIYNTIIKGSVIIKNAELRNVVLEDIYDSLVLVNVDSKGTLKLDRADINVVTSVFFHNVQIEQFLYLAFEKFGNVIFSNSSLPLLKTDIFTSISSVWFYESVIRVGGYLVFQDINEFAAYATRIEVTQVEKESLPILRVSYCTLVVITSMVFDHNIDRISLRIEQTTTAALFELVVSNSVSASTFGNNVQLRNIRRLYLMDSLFVNNVANYSSLRLNQVSSLIMNNVSFINNSGSYGAVSFTNEEYTYTSLSLFKECQFIGNRANSAGGGAIYISYTPVSFANCQFKDNNATIGGAIYSRYGLTVEGSIFIGNRALYAGGAILAQDAMSITATSFLENSVISKDVVSCGLEICKGNGGAIYFDADTAGPETKLISNRFERNSAVSGGAISLRTFSSLLIDNNTIINNVASISGGGIFYSLDEVELKSNSITGNFAGNYGNDISTPIKIVEWGPLAGDVKQTEMNLYPGEVFSLSPTFADFLGAQFNNCQETFNTATTPESYSLSSNIDFKNMFITTSNSTFLPTKITTFFFFLKTSATLTINVMPCPNGFSVNQANYGSYSSYICKPNTPTDYITIVAVCVTTIVAFAIFLLILALSIFLCVKIGRKVLYWVYRDKAEKDIEKRLLENEYITLDEPGHQQEKSYNDKKNSFVISIDQIVLERKIGEGGSGVVYLAKWHHNAVAVKCLRIDMTTSGGVDSDEIEKEAAMLCRLRHPNIYIFFGISISLHKQYLIVEYLERGSLEKLITEMRRIENPTVISFVEKLNVLIDITCGMVYLHGLKIIHRDLKPANILIDSKGVCKIADFGLSKIMSNTCHTSTTCVGTLFYIAPEVMKSDDGNDDNHAITIAVDVYSFSIIMWEMFFEDNPYMNGKSYKLHQFHSKPKKNLNGDPKTPFTVLTRVMQGERPIIPFSDEEEKMSWLEEFMPEMELFPNQKDSIGLLVSAYLDLMKSCWADDYRARPNFETVLNCLLLIKRQMQDISEKNNTQPTKTSSEHLELMDII